MKFTASMTVDDQCADDAAARVLATCLKPAPERGVR